MTKSCSKCRLVKPFEAFSIDRSKPTARCSYCRDCVRINHKYHQSRPEYKERDRIRSAIRRKTAKHKAYAKAYNSKYQSCPEGRARIRANRLVRVFGINVEAYNQILAEQAGVCAICGDPPKKGKWGMLVIDHDHNTGTIRGLLCRACNSGIGQLKDQVKVLYAAIEYLTQYDNKPSLMRANS